jgi:hypothetical protein
MRWFHTDTPCKIRKLLGALELAREFIRLLFQKLAKLVANGCGGYDLESISSRVLL